MPKIGKVYPGCRYWGYEPALADDARKVTMPGTPEYQAKAKAKESLKSLREAVKATGRKAYGMGLGKTKATAKAEELEKAFPGFEWNVFNHDYL